MTSQPQSVDAETPELAAFARKVAALIAQGLDERQLAEAVRIELSDLLAGGVELPAAKTRPNPERYVMYPLYVAPDGAFSIASAVWDVGQSTPVHGHETWGVVGIYSGTELETHFQKPIAQDVPLVEDRHTAWTSGQVSVCCTTDDDVHQVRCGGQEPVIGIHVYGADIGTLLRRSYDPVSGAVRWFTSTWAH